jgi:signal peptidase II
MHIRWVSYLIALVVFAADRWTKWIIESSLPLWETRVVIPSVFNIVHTQNTGAAFGFLADAEAGWRVFFLVVLSALVLVLVAALLWHEHSRYGPNSRWSRIALALILGGALGNLFDRILHGRVTDFLQVFIGSYEWPSFNVADAAISTGAVLLLLDLWTSRHKAPEAQCSQKS